MYLVKEFLNRIEVLDAYWTLCILVEKLISSGMTAKKNGNNYILHNRSLIRIIIATMYNRSHVNQTNVIIFLKHAILTLMINRAQQRFMCLSNYLIYQQNYDDDVRLYCHVYNEMGSVSIITNANLVTWVIQLKS